VEEIRFITTPKCSQCIPDESFRWRYACTGCEKLTPAFHIEVNSKNSKKNSLSKQEMLNRNVKILNLRTNGFSYGKIAGLLEIPRSTVQAVVLRLSQGAASANEQAQRRQVNG